MQLAIGRTVIRFLQPAAEEFRRSPTLIGRTDRFHIAPNAVLADATLNAGSGSITIGDFAFFGHGVIVTTGTHELTAFGLDRQRAIPPDGRDVTIGEGVWVASGAIVIGPVCIGEHAVLAAGAVVTQDVAPFSVVAGIPAREIRRLAPDDRDEGSDPN